MIYTVNYINDEVMSYSTPDDTHIKYPGGKWDLETLTKLCDQNFKVVLHGIIPSSGSILDPKLCDNFDNFSKFIKSTNQRWLSFHFEYKEKYGNRDYINTLEKNLSIIRSYFPDIEILIENMPPVDHIEDWCKNPALINEMLEKYNLNLLLDISHARISAESMGISFNDYIDQLNLDKVTEIHISGTGKTKSGKLYDAHASAQDIDFAYLSYALSKCKNLKMLSLEFSPTRDYDGETYAQEYMKTRTNKDLYREQQEQLSKIKALYQEIQNSEEVNK